MWSSLIMHVWCPIIFKWSMLIMTMPKDPIVKDTTSKHKFNLCLVGMKRFVVKNLEPILRCTKSPFYSDPKGGVTEIEEFPLIM
jgi:hypothetical protein